MSINNVFVNRRGLLQFMAAAVCMPVLPGKLLASSAAGRRLVLVELSGANDGLNTVVPYKDDRYYELRPRLSLSAGQRIPLDADYAFHQGMQAAMPLWEQGELSIVHGLGYPVPNRSHFKSIAIWESGGDGRRNRREGWITHAIEHAFAANRVDAHGISFGGGMNVFASNSDSGNWLSLDSPWQLMSTSAAALQSGVKEPVNSTNPSALQLIQQRSGQLGAALQRFHSKLGKNKVRSRIQGGVLAKQLNHVVDMIGAGVESPVYKVRLPGFDTHDNQHGRHDRLLHELSGAIAGFRRELQQRGEWQNTLLVTYSEFGRRARENRSQGTDHGTAAPHFVAGGALNGGFYGAHPDLGNLVDDDLQFTMDYRALYQRLLSDWLAIDASGFSAYQDSRLNRLI